MANYMRNVKSLKKKSNNADGEITVWEYPHPCADIHQKERHVSVKHLHEAQMIKKSMNEFIRAWNNKKEKVSKK